MLLLAIHLLLGANCEVSIPDYSRADRFYIAAAKVPGFFTANRCGADDTAHMDVFATPSAARKTAELRWGVAGVTGSWSCTPLVFTPEQACPRGVLTFMEDGYEERVFVVVERRGHWVRIRLDKGTGWIHLSKADEVVDYYSLVAGQIAEMTKDWDGRVCARPGSRARTLGRVEHQAVTVLDARRVQGRLWFRVDLLADSPCNVHDPQVAASGWVRAYSATRQPSVSHFSRGC